MRIAYCTNVRLPSERAHGHQVARVCDALVKQGHEVHVFAPYRRNPIKNNYWSFHKAERATQLTYLGSFDPIDRWFLPKYVQLPVLNFQLCYYLRNTLSSKNFDVLYTRSPALLSALLTTAVPVVLELHSLPRRGRARFARLCNHCTLIVCLTTPMRQELASWGVKRERAIVEGDAVDLERFISLPDKKIARSQLGIRDLEKFTVGYAGSFKTMGLDKGVKHILEAVRVLRSQGIPIAKIIVGEHMDSEELERMRNEDLTPGTDLGFLNQEMMRLFYAACDLFIYPAPKTCHPYFIRDTSPLKIFEYMAARQPIVAADLPPLRDILSEETAFLCKPGDAQSLADAIERVLKKPEEAAAKVTKAWQIVQEHTWEKRMQRIMNTVTLT